MSTKKVLVALSGGVDSSVAVHLLRQQGYEVEGIILEFSPVHKAAVQAAQVIADQLDVKLHVVECHKEFERNVILPFCREYQAGRTPNPCIFCNPTTKFGIICQLIKHLGFSFHDTYPVFTQILNDYDWDFVQIQLNYLDWQNQGAEQLYRELEKRNLPCMVMEPVRGGYLATLDEQRAKPFLEMEPNRSIASWAIRWVESLPQVTVVLSGMSDMAQLEDNVAMMTNFEPMNEKELEAVAKVVEEIRKVNDIPCTGCRYCMDCPMGVDIPEIFAIYSRLKIDHF